MHWGPRAVQTGRAGKDFKGTSRTGHPEAASSSPHRKAFLSAPQHPFLTSLVLFWTAGGPSDPQQGSTLVAAPIYEVYIFN